MNPVVDILPDDGTTGNVYELRIYRTRPGRRPAIRRELQEGPSRPRQVLEDLGRLGPVSSRSPTNGSTSGATRTSRSASRCAAMR